MSRGEKILKTIVYTRWIFALVVLLLFVALLVGCKISNARRQNPPEDIYANYRIHDYHLSVCEDAIGEIYGEYERDLLYDPSNPVMKDVTNRYFVRYKVIEGEDSAGFVLTEIGLLFVLGDGYHPFVMQSPDMDVDVFREWTVKDAIVDYVTDERSVSIVQNGVELHDVVLSMRDGFDESIEFLRHRSEQSELVKARWLSAAAQAKLDALTAEEGKLSVRFTFEESEAIVWTTDVRYDQGYLVIDVGTTHPGYTPYRRYVAIEENSPLYNAIIAALEAYAEEK